jgi:diguanylate cyclase
MAGSAARNNSGIGNTGMGNTGSGNTSANGRGKAAAVAGSGTRSSPDRSLQVIGQHMARLSVAGLPRNYELFHEAISGTDTALSREVMALNTLPSQAELDDIGLRHQLPGFVALASQRGRQQEIRALSDLKERMMHGATQRQSFARALETVARSLREDQYAGHSASPADILAEIEYLSVTLSDTVVAETELSDALRACVTRLADAERDNATARAATVRDRLTSLPNHAALTERLETLYGPDGQPRGTALFLVSIADLSDIAQTYGEPAATRILRKAGSIFRKAIKKNDFLARTGKDEFAFLLSNVERDSIQPIADRLTAQVADHLVFATSNGVGKASVEIAIGVALGAEAFSPQQLRLQAATALEVSRSRGRIAVYSPEIGSRTAS